MLLRKGVLLLQISFPFFCLSECLQNLTQTAPSWRFLFPTIPDGVAPVLCFQQDSKWTYHSKHTDTGLNTITRVGSMAPWLLGSRAVTQPEVICPSGDIWQHLNIFLVVITWRRCSWSGMLLRPLQCTEQPPQTNIYIMAPNVNSVKVEKTNSRVRMSEFILIF